MSRFFFSFFPACTVVSFVVLVQRKSSTFRVLLVVALIATVLVAAGIAATLTGLRGFSSALSLRRSAELAGPLREQS